MYDTTQEKCTHILNVALIFSVYSPSNFEDVSNMGVHIISSIITVPKTMISNPIENFGFTNTISKINKHLPKSHCTPTEIPK